LKNYDAKTSNAEKMNTENENIPEINQKFLIVSKLVTKTKIIKITCYL